MNVASLEDYRKPLSQMSLRELFRLYRAGDERARAVTILRLDILEAELKIEAIEDHDDEQL